MCSALKAGDPLPSLNPLYVQDVWKVQHGGGSRDGQPTRISCLSASTLPPLLSLSIQKEHLPTGPQGCFLLSASQPAKPKQPPSKRPCPAGTLWVLGVLLRYQAHREQLERKRGSFSPSPEAYLPCPWPGSPPHGRRRPGKCHAPPCACCSPGTSSRPPPAPPGSGRPRQAPARLRGEG